MLNFPPWLSIFSSLQISNIPKSTTEVPECDLQLKLLNVVFQDKEDTEKRVTVIIPRGL